MPAPENRATSSTAAPSRRNRIYRRLNRQREFERSGNESPAAAGCPSKRKYAFSHRIERGFVDGTGPAAANYQTARPLACSNGRRCLRAVNRRPENTSWITPKRHKRPEIDRIVAHAHHERWPTSVPARAIPNELNTWDERIGCNDLVKVSKKQQLGCIISIHGERTQQRKLSIYPILPFLPFRLHSTVKSAVF
jgi:hypothetical protein